MMMLSCDLVTKLFVFLAFSNLDDVLMHVWLRSTNVEETEYFKKLPLEINQSSRPVQIFHG